MNIKRLIKSWFVLSLFNIVAFIAMNNLLAPVTKVLGTVTRELSGVTFIVAMDGVVPFSFEGIALALVFAIFWMVARWNKT
jgi:hypothetical protein